MKEYKTIDEYINSFPENIQAILQTIRNIIKEEIPDVEEAMNYKMPTFKQNGNYIVYFAAWKKHISLYPFSSEMESLLEDPSAYKTSGKGTIQLQIDKPLPVKLIRDIVRFRLKENLENKKSD